MHNKTATEQFTWAETIFGLKMRFSKYSFDSLMKKETSYCNSPHLFNIIAFKYFIYGANLNMDSSKMTKYRLTDR